MFRLLSELLNPKGVLAPKGYREFLREKPFMSVHDVLDFPIKISPDAWMILNKFNKLINSQAVYLADDPGKDHWGPWRLVNGLRRGDCEDYAIHKLQALYANGWPRGALRLAVCEIKPKGLDHSRSKPIYHCVLLVNELGRDPLILDNRRDKIIRMGVGETNEYRWIAEEWPGHTQWRKLS